MELFSEPIYLVLILVVILLILLFFFLLLVLIGIFIFLKKRSSKISGVSNQVKDSNNVKDSDNKVEAVASESVEPRVKSTPGVPPFIRPEMDKPYIRPEELKPDDKKQ